jgi:hypothetical protein
MRDEDDVKLETSSRSDCTMTPLAETGPALITCTAVAVERVRYDLKSGLRVVSFYVPVMSTPNALSNVLSDIQ